MADPSRPDRFAYINALYWSSMTLTTIGYGDIVPETAAQRVFIVFMMLIGAFMYGYVIGAVSAILSAQGERRHQFTSTMNKLNAFMQNRMLPPQLRYQLRHYFRCAPCPITTPFVSCCPR